MGKKTRKMVDVECKDCHIKWSKRKDEMNKWGGRCAKCASIEYKSSPEYEETLTKRRADLTNKKFGKLTAVKFFDIHKKRRRWLCVCDCGNNVAVDVSSLTTGHTLSCGCYKTENTSIRSKTHGMSKNTPEYRVWSKIKERCYNPNNKSYKDYGGRGIKMCDEWLYSFETFFHDMGIRPSNIHSIERVENDKGYYKENCRWATRVEQNNNKRNNINLTFKGKTQNIAQWSRELGITRQTINNRIEKGCPMYQVLSKTRIKEVKLGNFIPHAFGIVSSNN